MGGVHCSHSNTEEVTEHANYIEGGGSLLRPVSHRIVTERCKDCLREVRVDKTVGRLTGITYSQQPIQKNSCTHPQWDLMDGTTTIEEKDTLGGVLVGMFTAHWFQPKERYFVAHVKCARCTELLWARADIHAYYDQGKLIQTPSGWRLMTESVPDQTSYKQVPRTVRGRS